MYTRLVLRYLCWQILFKDSKINMITFRSKMRLIYGIVMLLCVYPSFAQDTLNVMYYNVLNFPGTTPYRVAYFRAIMQYVQPDVLVITELSSEEGADILLNQGLNVGSQSNYSRAEFHDGPDTDNMLFYRNDKLALYAQHDIVTDVRLISEYVLYPVSPDPGITGDTTFVRFYSAHLKSSTGSANEQARLDMVTLFNQYLVSNSIDQNIIFGGDFNFYDDGEPAYQYLTDPMDAGLIDPLPAGDWHDNQSFASIHTQSTRLAQFGGGAPGGLDDRFDFILFSDDINAGSNQISYVPGSCYAFGNDGNHLNVGILDLPVNTSVPDSVLQALYYMTDHLPVVCKLKVEQPVSNDTAWLDVKVFLEGAWNGNEMAVSAPDQIPEMQPFSEAPWHYTGTETLDPINPTQTIDWCLLELRVSTGNAQDALSDAAVWRKACLVMSDGTIRDTDEVSLPYFIDQYSGNKFLIIRHRNHLDVMASQTLMKSDSIYAYDFSLSDNSVYGGVSGYTQISENMWGMTAGDVDGNGIINLNDLNIKWKNEAGNKGYLKGDVNFDFEVNNRDKNDYILPHLSQFSPVPE